MNLSIPHRPSARSYAALSIGAAITTIALKFGAYKLTGSVGLLSGVKTRYAKKLSPA